MDPPPLAGPVHHPLPAVRRWGAALAALATSIALAPVAPSVVLSAGAVSRLDAAGAVVAAAQEAHDDVFGRLSARGSYEIRSLATAAVLGREDWELYEDAAGFRTLRGTTVLEVDGARTSRTATVTVNPEMSFVEADVGSTAEGLEAYATFRRTGDLLTVEAFGALQEETRQQVRFPADGVFASQLFATRGWELAPFGRGGEETRPVYLVGSAPGVLVGEVRSLSARMAGREQVQVPAGRFAVFLFDVPLWGGPTPASIEDQDEALDRWWVLTGSQVPIAAELPSLGVRVELVAFEQNPDPPDGVLPGPVLARGVYHHRPLRQTDPLAVESWTLAAAPGGGYVVQSEVAYTDGRRIDVNATADSLFRVQTLELRRRTGREAEALSWKVSGGELQGEARGGGVGFARQRVPVDAPVLFRLEVAALEGWAITPEGTGRALTYWLPSGPHPLGTVLELPPEIALGKERVATPARTFEARRYASPADTPLLFRSTRWVFGPYRLPARVLFPSRGQEAILVRYETPRAQDAGENGDQR